MVQFHFHTMWTAVIGSPTDAILNTPHKINTLPDAFIKEIHQLYFWSKDAYRNAQPRVFRAYTFPPHGGDITSGSRSTPVAIICVSSPTHTTAPKRRRKTMTFRRAITGLLIWSHFLKEKHPVLTHTVTLSQSWFPSMCTK